MIQRQRQMTATVHEREPNNRAIFSPPGIGQQSSDKREKIDGRSKDVELGFGLSLPHGVKITLCIHEHAGHEHDENGPHAIVAKPLRSFIRH